MGKVLQKAEMEKGLLWGTKLAFFRRKEIRVSLLLILMQSPCHFNLSIYFLLKRSIQGGFAPFSLLRAKGGEYNFLYFSHLPDGEKPSRILFY
jgi:hypothetical protein